MRALTVEDLYRLLGFEHRLNDHDFRTQTKYGSLMSGVFDLTRTRFLNVPLIKHYEVIHFMYFDICMCGTKGPRKVFGCTFLAQDIA